MNPFKYETPTGKIIVLYSARFACKQLGIGRKRLHTLLTSGVLPMTPFKSKSGHRLFSQDQLDIFGYYMSRLERNKLGRIYNSWFQKRVKKKHDLLLAEYGLKKLEGEKENALSVRAKRYSRRISKEMS